MGCQSFSPGRHTTDPTSWSLTMPFPSARCRIVRGPLAEGAMTLLELGVHHPLFAFECATAVHDKDGARHVARLVACQPNAHIDDFLRSTHSS